MADEATTQETTTENSTVDNVETTSTETVDNTTVSGADVQGTETDSKATDSVKETEKQASKSYDEAYVKKLRDEAANARVKGKEAAEEAARKAADEATKAYTDKIGRALGLIHDDTPVDPKVLLEQATQREATAAKQRDEAAAELRALRVEKALNNAADKFDGDKDILAPFLAGKGALKDLDPAADDFASQVEALVENAVTTNPKLKKTVDRVSASRSGGDLSGGNAASKPGSPKSIDDIRREKREARARELS